MPMAIPAVVALAANASIATAVTIAVTAVVANQVSISQRKKAQDSLTSKGTTLSGRSPVASHKLVYGRQRVGGTMFFMGVTGTDNKYAHIAVVHAAHEIDAVEAFLLGDESFTPDYAGMVSANSGLSLVNTAHHGAAGDGADAGLVATGSFTTSDKVTGMFYSYSRFEWNADKFPSGLPNPSAVIRGRKVYDPRTTTTAWSDNPALCILDYLRDVTYGLGCADDEIDFPSFVAAANACDESVYSGTRYTLNGVVDTADTPRTILENMLTGCAGMLVNSGGVWRLIAGADRAVSATFTLDHLRGPLAPQCGDSLRDTCNGVKGVFVSPDTQWQPADFVPHTSSVTAPNITAGAVCSIATLGSTDFTAIGAGSNAVGVIFTATGAGSGDGTVDHYLGEDGGQRMWRDVEYPFTIDSGMAHRLARIELEKARQDISIPLNLNLAGLSVTVGDIIRLPFDRYGWNIDSGGKKFEVTSWKLVTEETADGPLPGVDIIAREYAPGVFDDGPETTVDLASNTSLYDFKTVPVPAGLTLSTSNLAQPDGTITPRIQVQWSAPADAFITSGGKVQIEYKKTADSVWLVWQAALRGDATQDFINGVQGGTSYDVRLRFENSAQVDGAYCTTVTYTLTNDTTAPAAPTGFAATAGAGCVVLDWADNAEQDLDHYEVYRNTANTFPGGTPLWTGYASQHVDFGITPGTLYYYWLKASDASDNLSTATASVNATPSSAGGTGTTGNYTDIIFKRALSAPSTPTGDTPSGWYDAPPADDGTYLWMSKGEKTSGGTLTGAWSTPVRLTSPADVAYLHIKFSNDGGTTFTAGGGETVGTFVGSLRDITEADSTNPADYTWTPWAGGVAYVEYSVDGSTSWHSTFTTGDLFAHTKIGAGAWSAAYRIVGEPGAAGAAGAAGKFTDYVFRRAATAPSTPTGDTPSSWYDAPPAADGNPLWISTADKTSAGVLIGAWSTPVQMEGAGMVIEYSVDGSTLWHATFVSGDLFAHQKVFGGTFSPAFRIVGEQGAAGAAGGYTDYVFKRSASVPSTPTGDTPAGWYDAPPAADGNPLWMSVGDKTGAGALVGSWATPVQTEGAGLVIEYSVNGSSSWHSTFTAGDLYAHQKVFGGSWSAAYRIVGETGTPGSNGTNAPATQFQYSVNGTTSWHSPWVAGDLYVRTSVDGGATWSGAALFVGPKGDTGSAGGTPTTLPDYADGGGNNIVISKPAGATSAYNVTYSIGGGAPQTMLNFSSFTITMTNHTQTFALVANDAGYSTSYLSTESWNSLFL